METAPNHGLGSGNTDLNSHKIQQKLRQRLTMALAPENKMQPWKNPMKNVLQNIKIEWIPETTMRLGYIHLKIENGAYLWIWHWKTECNSQNANRKIRTAHKYMIGTGKQDATWINSFKIWNRRQKMGLASENRMQVE